MKSIRFEVAGMGDVPRELVMERVRSVIREELTELQRYTLVAYYFERRKLREIAEERGISVSTACRTLKRAENRLRRFLQY